MKAEDEMFPGKVSGASDGNTEALVTQRTKKMPGLVNKLTINQQR